jgi:hypothetical protein
MGVRIDNANKMLLSIMSELMSDDDVFRLLYYTGSDYQYEDIYSLPIPKNDELYEIDKHDELYNKKVFVNKRIDSISYYADVSLFVNLYNVVPTMHFYQESKHVRTFVFQIGIVCHKDVRQTLNGFREIALAYRIMEMLQDKELAGGVGTMKLTDMFPIYDVPTDYVAYSLKLEIDGVMNIDGFK